METEVKTVNQFLTFTLMEERYAVDVGTVREVLEINAITRVPKSPEYMRGVINLRGAVVPVIDLKLKFGMGRTEKTVDACIIVTEVRIDAEEVVLGILADAVQEVVELDGASMEPPPRIGTRLDTGIIRGMGKHDGGFLIILELDKVFSGLDLNKAADSRTNDSASA
jgi:purine-binding chemotaxis protein CheW